MKAICCGVVLVGGLLLPGTGARAQECPGAETQFQLNQCADEAFKAADRNLNRVYGALTRRLDGADDVKGLLVQAQRAWLALRDAECDFKTVQSRGGSVHPMMLELCRADATRKRTAELSAYIDCMTADDDLACSLR